MSWQRYTDPVAVKRLDVGMCPECGYPVASHDGSGGPEGCTLTDNGVAGRIWQYEQDAKAQRRG